MEESEPLKLTAKQARILERCLRELFAPKAFGDVGTLKGLEFGEAIRRLVSVSEEQGIKIPLSSQGLSAHDRIVSTLHTAHLGGDEALYSDIWGSVRRVVERCFARKERPEGAAELTVLVRDELGKSIQCRTFVSPLMGVTIVDGDEI